MGFRQPQFVLAGAVTVQLMQTEIREKGSLRQRIRMHPESNRSSAELKSGPEFSEI
ncbi:MAG: hypothetical protein OXF88_19175 [Rhodobacteraceae bacterium]|nr:hypothetical protein [Paracoccaceae bacterium]